ncbi:hypothetical protein PR202_ga25861 [Eleusine coracana subsp. coracana]|uniref:Uncharacterized protein n=1 Tax=Eleusine coracana subsp. coracana TaxID=191504 RepID=A0AAV5DCN8_ELECO|nr:hypothetical protein PR202_ga25861 [Eleusine coracana subsp. coracana]
MLGLQVKKLPVELQEICQARLPRLAPIPHPSGYEPRIRLLVGKEAMDSTDQAYRFPLLEDDDPREVVDTPLCACVATFDYFIHAAARNVSSWHGTSYLAPLVGAFLADSYLGQYWTTVIFCATFIVGMVMLVLSAAVSLAATDFRNREEALLQEYAKFFDKAAIVILPDSEPVGILILEQMYSTFVEQAGVMDKHIGVLEIPAASFQIVDVITVLALLPVYEKVIVSVLRKFTGLATGITPLQRMGISLVLSTLSMVSAALVESYRLQIAHAKGLVHHKVAVPVSILYQGPQYFFIGAVGYYLSSLIISLVPVFTGRGGSPGWIPDNLNEGRLDCFYWMLAMLSFLNLLAFVLCAMRYKSRKAC